VRNLIMVLRVIHIFSGIFWVGFSIFNIGFLQPAISASGAGGQQVMGYLTQKTRLLATVYTAATLTLLSGLTMYALLVGLRIPIILSGYGIVLTTGATAGLIAWIIAIFVIRGIINQIQGLGREIRAQGTPPSPEQAGRMGALSARMNSVGQVGVGFMVLAVLGMAIAQYAPF
jgi:uncharacterized membrane protein